MLTARNLRRLLTLSLALALTRHMRSRGLLTVLVAVLVSGLVVAPAHGEARAAAACPPTEAPTALEPAGRIDTARPTFRWTPVAGAGSYTLFVLRVSDESIVVRAVSLTSTSYTHPSDLPTGEDLRWKVKSESPCGPGPYSESLHFRVAGAACPPTQGPTALEPTGPVGTTRPTFRWTPVVGASSYTLFVLRVSDESIVVRAIDLTSTSYTPSLNLPTGVGLRWKVKGESPCGSGPYSESMKFRVRPAPGLSATITSPVAGSTVSGAVNVTATATAASRVEFYVDGALQSVDTAAPYEFAWNSGTNPLPAATHRIDMGYYFVEWKDESTFAQRRNEVAPYTNLYYASLASYNSAQTQAQYMALLDRSLANAAAEGKKIHLNLELNRPELSPFLDAILDTAAPYWSRLVRVEIADEPDWSRAELESVIATVESKRHARGLPRPPQGYGVVYDYRFAVPDSANAIGLDWVGIEAYLDPPGNPTSQVNVDALTNRVRQRMAEVPAGRNIHLVPMAYDRNGAWTDIETLRDLQTPVYLLAHNDPRVIAINMFSYTRAGGSRDHPDLRTPHRLMAEKALDISVPGAALGRRTVTVKAFDAAGNSVGDRVAVIVQ